MYMYFTEAGREHKAQLYEIMYMHVNVKQIKATTKNRNPGISSFWTSFEKLKNKRHTFGTPIIDDNKEHDDVS